MRRAGNNRCGGALSASSSSPRRLTDLAVSNSGRRTGSGCGSFCPTAPAAAFYWKRTGGCGLGQVAARCLAGLPRASVRHVANCVASRRWTTVGHIAIASGSQLRTLTRQGPDKKLVILVEGMTSSDPPAGIRWRCVSFIRWHALKRKGDSGVSGSDLPSPGARAAGI